MLYTLAQQITEQYVLLIQDYFNSDFVTKDYRWAKNLTKTKVQIINEFTDTERKLPQITIKAALDTNVPISFGDDLVQQGTDTEGKPYFGYGGLANSRVTITLRAGTYLDRSVIGDLLFLGLAYPIRNVVRKQGIETLPPFVRVERIWNEPLQGGDTLVQQWCIAFGFTVQTQWFEVIDLSELKTLEQILMNRVAGTTDMGTECNYND